MSYQGPFGAMSSVASNVFALGINAIKSIDSMQSTFAKQLETGLPFTRIIPSVGQSDRGLRVNLPLLNQFAPVSLGAQGTPVIKGSGKGRLF